VIVIILEAARKSGRIRITGREERCSRIEGFLIRKFTQINQGKI
jgi:hypothetical protein